MSRIDRINQLIKEEVSRILQSEISDPRVRFVTVTKVEVSRDLQHAKIFYSVLGNPTQVQHAKEGLNNASGYIRRLIGQAVRIRYTPELDFIYDKSMEYTTQIEQTLKEIKNESQKNHSNPKEK